MTKIANELEVKEIGKVVSSITICEFNSYLTNWIPGNWP